MDAPPYSPYASSAANAIYNLMFCDDVASFAAARGAARAPWQATLASGPPDVPALQALAASDDHDARVRYLACKRLREAGVSVASKQLFGVIVEMPLDGGLDTLAAYADGGVRYVNQSGKMVVSEGAVSVDALLAAARPVVQAIGPWEHARRAPPARGHVRLTFLTSDGLAFGEGPVATMRRDPMAAPILERATDVLKAVTALDVADAIFGYLERRPEAQDSLDGIAGWWLAGDAAAPRDALRDALKRLVADGRVVESVAPDGRCLYRARRKDAR